eukprot:g82546.t1
MEKKFNDVVEATWLTHGIEKNRQAFLEDVKKKQAKIDPVCKQLCDIGSVDILSRDFEKACKQMAQMNPVNKYCEALGACQNTMARLETVLDTMVRPTSYPVTCTCEMVEPADLQDEEQEKNRCLLLFFDAFIQARVHDAMMNMLLPQYTHPAFAENSRMFNKMLVLQEYCLKIAWQLQWTLEAAARAQKKKKNVPSTSPLTCKSVTKETQAPPWLNKWFFEMLEYLSKQGSSRLSLIVCAELLLGRMTLPRKRDAATAFMLQRTFRQTRLLALLLKGANRSSLSSALEVMTYLNILVASNKENSLALCRVKGWSGYLVDFITSGGHFLPEESQHAGTKPLVSTASTKEGSSSEENQQRMKRSLIKITINIFGHLMQGYFFDRERQEDADKNPPMGIGDFCLQALDTVETLAGWNSSTTALCNVILMSLISRLAKSFRSKRLMSYPTSPCWDGLWEVLDIVVNFVFFSPLSLFTRVARPVDARLFYEVGLHLDSKGAAEDWDLLDKVCRFLEDLHFDGPDAFENAEEKAAVVAVEKEAKGTLELFRAASLYTAGLGTGAVDPTRSLALSKKLSRLLDVRKKAAVARMSPATRARIKAGAKRGLAKVTTLKLEDTDKEAKAKAGVDMTPLSRKSTSFSKGLRQGKTSPSPNKKTFFSKQEENSKNLEPFPKSPSTSSMMLKGAFKSLKNMPNLASPRGTLKKQGTDPTPHRASSTDDEGDLPRSSSPKSARGMFKRTPSGKGLLSSSSSSNLGKSRTPRSSPMQFFRPYSSSLTSQNSVDTPPRSSQSQTRTISESPSDNQLFHGSEHSGVGQGSLSSSNPMVVEDLTTTIEISRRRASATTSLDSSRHEVSRTVQSVISSSAPADMKHSLTNLPSLDDATFGSSRDRQRKQVRQWSDSKLVGDKLLDHPAHSSPTPSLNDSQHTPAALQDQDDKISPLKTNLRITTQNPVSPSNTANSDDISFSGSSLPSTALPQSSTPQTPFLDKLSEASKDSAADADGEVASEPASPVMQTRAQRHSKSGDAWKGPRRSGSRSRSRSRSRSSSRTGSRAGSRSNSKGVERGRSGSNSSNFSQTAGATLHNVDSHGVMLPIVEEKSSRGRESQTSKASQAGSDNSELGVLPNQQVSEEHKGQVEDMAGVEDALRFSIMERLSQSDHLTDHDDDNEEDAEDDQVWEKAQLATCAVCDKLLTNDAIQHGGKFYCMEHYVDRFESCSHCDKPLRDNEEIVTFALPHAVEDGEEHTLLFHQEHFKCYECNKNLTETDEARVHEPTRRLYCIEHYDKKYGQSCSFCSQVLPAFSNQISAVGAFWHPNHLICAGPCKSPLQLLDFVFYPVDIRDAEMLHAVGIDMNKLASPPSCSEIAAAFTTNPFWRQRLEKAWKSYTAQGLSLEASQRPRKTTGEEAVGAWHKKDGPRQSIASLANVPISTSNEEEEGSLFEAPFCSPCYMELFSPICAGCGQRTADKSVVSIASSGLLDDKIYFHLDCHRCSAPGCTVKHGDGVLVLEEDKLLCEAHFEAAGPACTNCSLTIQSSKEEGILIRDQAYHSKCVRCAECDVLLGEQVFIYDGNADKKEKPQLMCKQHLMERRAPKCTHCFKPILTGGLVVDHQPFHADCIVCKVCDVPLGLRVRKAPSTARPDQMGTYCETHFIELFMPHKTAASPPSLSSPSPTSPIASSSPLTVPSASSSPFSKASPAPSSPSPLSLTSSTHTRTLSSRNIPPHSAPPARPPPSPHASASSNSPRDSSTYSPPAPLRPEQRSAEYRQSWGFVDFSNPDSLASPTPVPHVISPPSRPAPLRPPDSQPSPLPTSFSFSHPPPSHPPPSSSNAPPSPSPRDSSPSSVSSFESLDRQCPMCNKEARGGRLVNVGSQLYHAECFFCAACGKTFPDKKFVRDKTNFKFHHAECLRR